MVDLRDHVTDLKRKRLEASTENDLLKQLTSLWERLCAEVESEIQEGVRKQLGFESQGEGWLPNALNSCEVETNVITRATRSNTVKQQQQKVNKNKNNKLISTSSSTADVITTLLEDENNPSAMEL